MKPTFREYFICLLLINLGQIFNYFYQIVIGRCLSPAEYGVFNSLNSIAVLASAPLGVVPLVVAKYTVSLSLSGPAMVRGLLARTLCLAGALGLFTVAAGAALSPLLKAFLHLDHISPVFNMLVLVGLGFVLPVPQGLLQGLHRFNGYAYTHIGLTLGRLVAAVGLVGVARLGVDGALLSGSVGSAISLAVGMLLLKDMVSGERVRVPVGVMREMAGFSLSVLVFTVFMTTLGNLDLVLVRHYCLPSEAGLYSTAAVFGRIAYFLPAVLANLMFPQVVRNRSAGEDSRGPLWKNFLLSLVLGGGVALVFSLAPDRLITLILGGEYAGAGDMLMLVSIAMALLASLQILVTFDLAEGRHTSTWVTGLGAASMAGLIFVFHASALQIAQILLAVVAVLFVVLLALQGISDQSRAGRAMLEDANQ
jgi:O-antigen/teichoic acid export membrane protein